MYRFHVYQGNYSYFIKEALLKREGWEENTDGNNPFVHSNFIWKPVNLSIQGYTKLDGIVKNHSKDFVQIFNHFEINRGICTKTGLIRSLRKYYNELPEAKSAKYGVFDSTATSFIITAGVEDYEYNLFVTRFKDIAKQHFGRETIPMKHCTNNFWLVKPANMNQGRGIAVLRTLKEINQFLASKTPNSFWVVQKYIERPLLYNERKFDIRVWAIFTCTDEVFIYKKAYVRTSSDSYDLANHNNYVHLTNQCLQVHGENYGKHEDGNTLALHDLDAYFKEKFPDLNITVEKDIKPRIKDLIIDTFLCYNKQMNPNRRKNAFELFGYDFLIDEDFRTWLIEVNTNPYLGTPNKYMEVLVPNMIDDMLDLVVEPQLLQKNKQPRERENDFELVYCESGSKFHEGPINQRSPFNKSLYPAKDLTPPDYLRRISGISDLRSNQNLNGSQIHSPSTRKASKANNNEYSSFIAAANMTKSTDMANEGGNFSHVKTRFKMIQAERNSMGGTSPMRQSGNPAIKAINNNDRISQLKNFESQPIILDSLESDRSGTNIKVVDEEGLQKISEAHLRSSSLEDKHLSSTNLSSSKNNIETIYKNLHLALIYKSSSNVSTIAGQLSRVLACLSNWELLSDKHVKIACKSLNLIAQSGANLLLAEQNNILTLSDLLTSPNVKNDIKFSVVEAITYLARDVTLKKKIMCNKLVHDLINIILSSCVQKPEHEYSKSLKLATLKCLETLGGIFNRKVYIPGETRELDKIRNFFTAQGGIIAMWILGTRSLEDDIRDIAVRSFLSNLEMQDWDKQLQVLKLFKAIPSNELPKPEEKPIVIIDPEKNPEENKLVAMPVEENSPADIIFYRSGDFQLMEKAFNNKLERGNIDKIITFPTSVFKIISYEKLLEDFSEFVKSVKDSLNKKENEERERKLVAEAEKHKKQDNVNKRQVQEDRTRLAYESNLESKLKMSLKRQQIELSKRQKEIEENRMKEIEERDKYLESIWSKKFESKLNSTNNTARRLVETNDLETQRALESNAQKDQMRVSKTPEITQKKYRVVAKERSSQNMKVAELATKIRNGSNTPQRNKLPYKVNAIKYINDVGSDSEDPAHGVEGKQVKAFMFSYKPEGFQTTANLDELQKGDRSLKNSHVIEAQRESQSGSGDEERIVDDKKGKTKLPSVHKKTKKLDKITSPYLQNITILVSPKAKKKNKAKAKKDNMEAYMPSILYGSLSNANK